MKGTLRLALAVFLALMGVAQAQQQYVPISQLPIPASGSTKLSFGDKVAANRNNITYGLVANFGSNCTASQWVNAISPQGFGTCTQPGFSNLSGALALSQIAGVYTNGQLLIGNTSSGHLQSGTITAGSNIVVTNSAGGITIAAGSVSSGVTIGTSLTAANPLISGDATSGLYTSGAGHVGIIIGHTLILDTSANTVAIGTNNLTMTGSIGATGARVTKGWFTDLQVTNAISGSVTGNAATVTTNANMTGPITGTGNVTSITAQTGTGTTFVMSASPTIATPTITTSETNPLLIGGSAVGANAEVRSTSGVGTTDFTKFTVGNAGATEAMRIVHSGAVGIGTVTPGTNAILAVSGGAAFGTYGGNATAISANNLVTSGSVGIGTATPANTLDVFTGGIHIGSSIPASTANALYANGSSLLWNGVSVSGTVSIGTATTGQTAYYSGSSTIGGVTANALSYGGLINKFRNGTIDTWQRGTASLATATGGAYTADGWIVSQPGAAFTCARDTGTTGTLYSLKCVGGTSNTGTTIAQRIESYVAAPMAGNTVTAQFQYKQDTGGAITPKISGCYASSQDNFASCTSDLAATSLTSCASGSWCTESYTFAVNASASQGYQITLDCNSALTSSQHCWMTAADVRVTPGVATGINTAPPPPELRPIFSELHFNQRYYQKTFPQGTAPAANLGVYTGCLSGTLRSPPSGTSWEPQTTWQFAVVMRAAPSVTLYSPYTTGAQWSNSSAVVTANARVLVSSDNGTSIDNAGVLVAFATSNPYVCASANSEL